MCLVVLPAFSHGRHYMGPPTMQTQAIQTLHRNNSNANTTNITGPPCYNHTNITQTSHYITQTSHKYHRSAKLQSHKHHTNIILHHTNITQTSQVCHATITQTSHKRHTTSHKHHTNITGLPCYNHTNITQHHTNISQTSQGRHATNCAGVGEALGGGRHCWL